MQRIALAVCTVAVIVGLAGLVAVAVSTHQPVPVRIPGALRAESEPAVQARGPAAAPTASAPLTGLPARDPAVLARPVAAVKVDNAAEARPQTGLDQADIVFEERADAGLTRLVALFHSVDPGTVGPVHSGTDVDADLLPAFSPMLGLSGAAGAEERLRAVGLRVLSEEGASRGAFFRALDRRAPHNLFARPRELWRAGASLPPAAPPWPFDPRSPLGGRSATGARIVFSPSVDVEWAWDTGRRAWLRRQDGRAHLVSSGRQIAAENVIVVTGVTAPVRNDAGSESANAVDVLGEGAAVVLRDGLAYDARWRKASPYSQFEWVTPARSPLPLAPGRTWIEFVPASGTLAVDQLP